MGLRVRIPPAICLSLVSVVSCQVEVLVAGRSLVQTSPPECVLKCAVCVRTCARGYVCVCVCVCVCHEWDPVQQ